RGSMVGNGLRLFAGAADGRLYAFDKGSGLSIWANQYAAPFSGQLTVFGDRIYVAGDAVTLFALDQATGHVAWRYRTRSSISCPVAVTDGVVFFGSTDGYVYAFSETRSKVLWRTEPAPRCRPWWSLKTDCWQR